MHRMTVEWEDSAGNQRTTYLSTGFGAASVLSRIAILSNASWLDNWDGIYTSGLVTFPGTALPWGVETVAMLQVDGLDGSHNRILLPAPDTLILNADNQTVNTSSAGIAALILDANGVLQVPLSGSFMSGMDAGWVMRRGEAIREVLGVVTPHTTYGFTAVWIDQTGRTIAAKYIQGSSTLDVLTDLEALSYASIIAYWRGDVTFNTSFAPLNTQYPNVQDTAELIGVDSTGNRTSIIVPAPPIDMFLADGETVDLNYGLVALLVAEIILNCVVPSSGNPVVDVIGGRLRKWARVGRA